MARLGRRIDPAPKRFDDGLMTKTHPEGGNGGTELAEVVAREAGVITQFPNGFSSIK